ncbi:MAG: YbjN domain-containing protein [Polyangiaceae bacterium]|nr:YbjN domain-containing protein [Polyangiaceae bacterium]
MRTVYDVEAYLEKMNRRYSAVDDQPGTFLIRGGEKMPPIAMRVDPPIVLFRVHIGSVVGDAAVNGALYEKLLVINAKSLVHTSFGLEDGEIVLVSALELENLDFNELAAALDEIDVTLAAQVPKLAELSKESLRAAHSSQRNA